MELGRHRRSVTSLLPYFFGFISIFLGSSGSALFTRVESLSKLGLLTSRIRFTRFYSGVVKGHLISLGIPPQYHTECRYRRILIMLFIKPIGYL